MPKLSTEQARANGLKGGRPKGVVDKKYLEKLRERARMDQMIAKQTAKLIRAAMVPALGQIFVYKIDTIAKKNIRITDPDEIAKALDAMEGNGSAITEEGTYVYITSQEPDYKAIEMLLSRLYGKPKESLDLNVEHSFSLLGLAKKRDEMIDGNDVMTVLDQGEMLAMPQVHIEQTGDGQVIVEATPVSDVVIESHE